MFGVQGVFKCIVSEVLGIFGGSLSMGVAGSGANKVNVQCVGSLYGSGPFSEGIVSSLGTFRLSLSFQAIEVFLNCLCAFCAFCVRFVYVGLVSRVGSIVESDVILG